MRSSLVLACLAAWLVSAGCYRPSLGDCAVRCGAGGACPSGLTCDEADGFCQADPASTCTGLPPPDDGGIADAGVVADAAPPGVLHYREISAGDDHACAIRRDGRLFCWGRGDEGQLGDGITDRRARPVRVGGTELTDWLAVESGARHSCGLRGASLPGELWCWGSNNLQQVTPGTGGVQLDPVQTPGEWKAVSAGEGVTCGIDAADRLTCWGTNGDGLLGAIGVGPHPPTAIGTDTYAAIEVNGLHACAIRTDGTLVCWGRQDQDGQLGTGDGLDRNVPTPVEASVSSGWKQIVSTFAWNCGIRELVAGQRTLWCWGRNSGNLGAGPGGGPSRVVPAQVGSATDWKSVTIGFRHGCGVRAEAGGDHLYCWGLNPEGQLGVGDRKDRFTPTRVDAASGRVYAKVSAGRTFTCAIDADEELFCFGEDAYGQLADGQAASAPAPSRVGAELGWTGVAVGRGHSCGLRGAELHCWGDNFYGQLGFPTAEGDLAAAPVRVEGAWKAVGVGENHTCAIDGDDRLKCWGVNDVGQLGSNQPTNSSPHPTPTLVFGGAQTWAQVALGRNVSCAIGAVGGASPGELFCWGADVFAQLGQAGGDRATPGKVAGGHTDWAQVAVGWVSTCGLRGPAGDRTPLCWGENVRGQLGQGTVGGRLEEPAPVATTDRNWSALAGGFFHFCGVQDDGDLRCWGGGGVGQRGDGEGTDEPTPVAPLGDETYRTVATGHSHTCAIGEDRRLACWGLNEHGQLGDGAPRSEPAFMPVTVSEEPVWDRLALGEDHSCGLRTDGSLWCWGRGTYGQLGHVDAATLAPRRISDPP